MAYQDFTLTAVYNNQIAPIRYGYQQNIDGADVVRIYGGEYLYVPNFWSLLGLKVAPTTSAVVANRTVRVIHYVGQVYINILTTDAITASKTESVNLGGLGDFYQCDNGQYYCSVIPRKFFLQGGERLEIALLNNQAGDTYTVAFQFLFENAFYNMVNPQGGTTPPPNGTTPPVGGDEDWRKFGDRFD